MTFNSIAFIGPAASSRRQNVPVYNDEETVHQRDEMYQTSKGEPAYLHNGDMTQRLINTLARDDSSNSDNYASSNAESRTQSYGDDMAVDKVDYEGFQKNHNEEASYYGDNMNGDFIETIGDNKEEMASRRSNDKQNLLATMNDYGSEFKNLQEYKHYPNEALESESVEQKKSPSSSSSSSSLLSSMKDAIAIDSHLIDKELKTLNEEDRQIGKCLKSFTYTLSKPSGEKFHPLNFSLKAIFKKNLCFFKTKYQNCSTRTNNYFDLSIRGQSTLAYFSRLIGQYIFVFLASVIKLQLRGHEDDKRFCF